MQNLFKLDGKVALVTGGCGLLGRAHVEALLEAGAKVIVADINEKLFSEVKNSFEQRFSSNLFCYKVNICCEKSIEELQDKLIKRGILVDILINNAAIDPKVEGEGTILDSSRLEHFSIDDWNSQLSVGLTGAYLCCKIFGKFMASRNGGVILNIASDLSVISPDQRLYEIDGVSTSEQPVKPITYSVIKHGLIGLTKYIATYWRESNVRCNALSPGGIYNGQSDDFVKSLVSRIPMGRMAKVDEYKASLIYLCSDASSYMTGQNIVIDGGRTIW